MRSRVASRRVGHVIQEPSDDPILPQHYETSKKNDDGPMTGRERGKGGGLLRRLLKRRYKSEGSSLCGDLRLPPKSRSSIEWDLVVPAVLSLCMASVIMYWLLMALSDELSRPERPFPLVVWVDSAKPSPIPLTTDVILDFPILIEQPLGRSRFNCPGRLAPAEIMEGEFVDHGNLDIYIMMENVSRVIYYDYNEEVGEVRDYSTRDDDVDTYYAFDDDSVRNVFSTYDDDSLKNTGRCRRNKWHRYHFPNCNSFHEMDVSNNVPVYLSYGAYRDVFIHEHKTLHMNERIIWKQSLHDIEFTYVSVQ